MKAKELKEYQRRLRLLQERKKAVRDALGFSSYPGRGVPHGRARSKTPPSRDDTFGLPDGRG